MKIQPNPTPQSSLGPRPLATYLALSLGLLAPLALVAAPELLDRERVGACVSSEIELREQSDRVDRPVTGLYEQIPVGEIHLPHWTFDDRRGDSFKGWSSSIRYRSPDGLGDAEGALVRRVERDVWGRRTLVLSAARLKPNRGAFNHGPEIALPSWIDVPGTVPLIAGKGIPTIVFATLRLMKKMEIPYGGLHRVKLETIRNVETAFQLHALIKKLSPERPRAATDLRVLGEFAKRTASYRYALTILQQSGHRVKRVRLQLAGDTTPRDLLKNLGREVDRREIHQLMNRYGVRVDEYIPYNFDITIDVEEFTEVAR